MRKAERWLPTRFWQLEPRLHLDEDVIQGVRLAALTQSMGHKWKAICCPMY
jgi:hypothetical protein